MTPCGRTCDAIRGRIEKNDGAFTGKEDAPMLGTKPQNHDEPEHDEDPAGRQRGGFPALSLQVAQ